MVEVTTTRTRTGEGGEGSMTTPGLMMPPLVTETTVAEACWKKGLGVGMGTSGGSVNLPTALRLLTTREFSFAFFS